MYLIDTNVISELRKKSRANPGVINFFEEVSASNHALYLSAVTVGELRRGLSSFVFFILKIIGYTMKDAESRFASTTVRKIFKERVLGSD